MSKTFKNYRNNFIDLGDIYGVDLKAGSITPHPSFVNVKENLRDDVMNSLFNASHPSKVPAIEVMMDDDGNIHIVDGYHRVENAIAKYKTDPDTWGKIKFDVFRGTVEEAQFRAVASNLEDARSPLTPAEQFKVVSRWVEAGMSVETIAKKLGQSNTRWINKVRDIMQNGIYAIEEAVRSNQIDLTTATQIARKVDVSEQKEVLQKAIEETKDVTNASKQSAVRQSLGIAQRSRKVRPYDEIKSRVLEYWDTKTAKEWEDGELDENIDGQLTAFAFVLGLDHLPLADIIEVFDKWYWDEREKEEALIAKQSGSKDKKTQPKNKAKKTTTAPWQVKS